MAGRGAYLHDSPECFAMAARRHLIERALKVRTGNLG